MPLPQTLPDGPPEHVQQAWEQMHAELQRRLEALWARRAAFKLFMEASGGGGLPRKVEWYEHDRQQPVAPRRT